MRFPIASCLLFSCFLVSSACAESNPETPDLDEFEISFFSKNYSAIRLPLNSPINAGDLLSRRDYSLMERLQYCVTDWEGVYQRGGTDFSLVSSDILRSAEIEGDVSSNWFSVDGKFKVSVHNKISDKKPFIVEQDSLSVPRSHVNTIVSSNCPRYKELFLRDIIPDDYIAVQKAIFLSGKVEYAYTISVSGAAGASASSAKIVDLLDSLPKLRALAKYFDADATISVGGTQQSSETYLLTFGDKKVDADGFIPMRVNPEIAREIVRIFQSSEETKIQALDATDGPEKAQSFLEKNPQLDVNNAESMLSLAFSGETVPYTNFVSENRDDSISFSYYYSKSLQINYIAGRKL